jgi:hypothetical protein
MKTGPSAFSILMMYVGMLLFLGPFLLSIAFPRVPIGWALAAGIALGAPVLVWSLHLQSKDMPGSQKSFLPHRSQWAPFGWNAIAGICLLMLLVLPGLLLTPWLVLPAGDAVSDAWARAGMLTLAWCIVPPWSRLAAIWVRRQFAGRVEPTFGESFVNPKPSSLPRGLAMLQRYSLELLVIAIGIAFISGLIAIPAGMRVPQGPRGGRGRGILMMLVWIRDNPNFLTAFTMLVSGKLLVQTLFELVWSRNGVCNREPEERSEVESE